MNPFASVTLLATDGSLEAGQATRLAVELSRSLGSELHTVYVEPLPSPYAFPESTVIDPDFRHEMRERAQQEASVKLEEEVRRKPSRAPSPAQARRCFWPSTPTRFGDGS